MMKNEFEKLIGKTVSDEEYSTIEYVYTWHPAIADVGGKLRSQTCTRIMA